MLPYILCLTSRTTKASVYTVLLISQLYDLHARWCHNRSQGKTKCSTVKSLIYHYHSKCMVGVEELLSDPHSSMGSIYTLNVNIHILKSCIFVTVLVSAQILRSTIQILRCNSNIQVNNSNTWMVNGGIKKSSNSVPIYFHKKANCEQNYFSHATCFTWFIDPLQCVWTFLCPKYLLPQFLTYTQNYFPFSYPFANKPVDMQSYCAHPDSNVMVGLPICFQTDSCGNCVLNLENNTWLSVHTQQNSWKPCIIIILIYIASVWYFRWILCHKKKRLQDKFDLSRIINPSFKSENAATCLCTIALFRYVRPAPMHLREVRVLENA